MTHFITMFKNIAEAAHGVATGDATKFVAAAAKTVTSAIPGGTLTHGLIDGALGNVATPLAENPTVQEAVKNFARPALANRDQAGQVVKNYLDANHDGTVDANDLREKATDFLDSNSDGIVDGSDLANTALETAGDVQDIFGTVGHEIADSAVEIASNVTDFLEMLDAASNLGA